MKVASLAEMHEIESLAALGGSAVREWFVTIKPSSPVEEPVIVSIEASHPRAGTARLQLTLC